MRFPGIHKMRFTILSRSALVLTLQVLSRFPYTISVFKASIGSAIPWRRAETPRWSVRPRTSRRSRRLLLHHIDAQTAPPA
ncbi:hypothetical protein GGR56DRAFT_661141 [Xylariaceae sp. FL0804]|nr:hypothetical protein GGR56DRAFT_661141 [Xylariaceae sp. FL0804]